MFFTRLSHMEPFSELGPRQCPLGIITELLYDVDLRGHYLELADDVIGPGTGLVLSCECLSYDATYFRTTARTFESML